MFDCLNSHERKRIKKSLKEKLAFGFGIIIAVAVILSIVFVSRNHERRITNFVINHEEEFEEIASDYLNGDDAATEYKGVKVDGVFTDENRIVQFYDSGSGLGMSTNYYGFYYSENDVPVAFQNCGYALTEMTDGEWEWTDGTDNGGVTKRIAGHWFYYEAWF